MPNGITTGFCTGGCAASCSGRCGIRGQVGHPNCWDAVRDISTILIHDIHDISCFIILHPSASSAHIKIRSVHPVDQQCVPLFQHKGRAHRTAGRSAGGTGSTHDTPEQF